MRTIKTKPIFTITHFLPLLLFTLCAAQDVSTKRVETLKVWNNQIFASFYPDHLYRSMDSGKTWEEVSHGICGDSLARSLGLINDIEIKNDTLYIGTACGVFRSPAANIQWESFSKGLSGKVSIIKRINNELYVVADTLGIFKHHSDSLKWVSANNGLPSLRITDMLSTDSLVFSCVNGDVYYSFVSEIKWEKLTSKLKATYIVRSQNIMLVANEITRQVSRSEDYGQHWILVDTGWAFSSLTLLSDLYMDSDIALYTDGGGRVIHFSQNNGLTWNNSVINLYIKKFARYGDFIIAGTDSGVIFSDDYFKTYSRFIGGQVELKPSEPAHDKFTVKYIKEKNSIAITIASNTKHEIAVNDLNGKRIKEYQGSFVGNYMVNNIFKPGIYIIQLRLDKREMIKRIVVL